MTDGSVVAQPLLIGISGGSLKAGTCILCENGHHQATCMADISPWTTDYSLHIGEWKQPNPTGQPMPIRCAECGGILIDWASPEMAKAAS